MLNIRQDQMDVFKNYMRHCFQERMKDRLRHHYPQETKDSSDEELIDLISNGTSKAAYYGFTDEKDMCRFIELMLIHGPNFDDSTKAPWAKKILTDKSLDPRIKMDTLDEFDLFFTKGAS